eukprot:4011646-Pleurochrysis_carterae.AAC.2
MGRWRENGVSERRLIARARTPRPRQGDEAADSHPACATVANELPPRQAGWNHIDLAWNEHARAPKLSIRLWLSDDK